MSTTKLKISAYVLISIFVLYTAFFSLYTNWWSVILIPAVVSIFGVFKRDKGFLSFGIVSIELYFLFLHISDPLNFLYLFIILGSFFLAYLTISLSNNAINIIEIYEQKKKSLQNPYIRRFKKSAQKYIIMTCFTALLVSFIGSFFSIFGYMSISNDSLILVVFSFVFTLILLGMIYLVIVYLPKKRSGFSMEKEL